MLVLSSSIMSWLVLAVHAESYAVKRMIGLEHSVCKLGNLKEMLALCCIHLNIREGKWLTEGSGCQLNNETNGGF